MLYDTKDKFIFIFDEWDYIFANNLFEENQNDFLEFLRNLLKDQNYVSLAYMTGVRPIKKYSSGSALNMFDEFTFLKDRTFDEYFGFTEEDVIEMVSGEEIDITIDEDFRAGQGAPRNKEEIYSAMIVLGFLSYHDGYLRIPNKELMKEFEKSLGDKSFGYVLEIIENSKRMLKATVKGDTKTVESILHDIHNSEISILQYWKSDSLHSLDKFREPNHRFGSSLENSLSWVLTLAYSSARDTYRVEREEKTGKGYADFTFHPRRKNDIPFIVELKKDELPEVAIKEIREKEYVEKIRREDESKKVLAVAICYDSKSKEHRCKIEEI